MGCDNVDKEIEKEIDSISEQVGEAKYKVDKLMEQFNKASDNYDKTYDEKIYKKKWMT